jgi:hypothetical protein
MTTTKQYMAIEIVSLPRKTKRSTDGSPRIFSVTAQVHVNNDHGAALFLFQDLVMTWITNSTQYIKKSPSIKAIAHDFNELAQAVKDDGRAKRLIWQNESCRGKGAHCQRRQLSQAQSLEKLSCILENSQAENARVG